ncbi:MAG: hypothetical protein JJU00_05825 [Opitutales bacterium]|nr:hypothetical protein [Opitutales bacterium]
MSDPKFHRFPHSGGRPGRFSGSDREAAIQRLKKDAPGIDKKRDHRTSVRSMTFAVFAAVGVMALFYLMNILDSVGEPPAADHLHRVDSIEAAPEERIQALIDRIEREEAEAEQEFERELEALMELDAQIRVDPWEDAADEGPGSPGAVEPLPADPIDARLLQELIPPAEIDVDDLDR